MVNEQGESILNDSASLDKAVHTVSQLTGKIKSHLKNEDSYLYPKLMSIGTEDIQKLSREFQDQKKGISTVSASYGNNFNTVKKIQLNIKGFIKTTNEISTAVERRFAQEEEKLYDYMLLPR